MKFFNNKFWKFAAIFTAIIILGLGVFWLMKYYQLQKGPEYQAQKYLEELERKYREDTYGGSTPEETLQFFIAALKNEDIELASKYFVIDKQEEWKGKLENAKEKNVVDEMVRDLSNAKRGKDISPRSALFSITNDKNEIIAMINIVRIINDKWKIESL